MDVIKRKNALQGKIAEALTSLDGYSKSEELFEHVPVRNLIQVTKFESDLFEFDFLGNKFCILYEIDAFAGIARMHTHKIVPNPDDYPKKKLERIDKMDISISFIAPNHPEHTIMVFNEEFLKKMKVTAVAEVEINMSTITSFKTQYLMALMAMVN